MISCVSSDLEVLKLIPGYDPFATANGCYYDPKAGQRPVDFFHECLQHVKGELAGQPLDLDPWQQSYIMNLFGWKRPDGTRRYRESLLYIPRKNGKTTMAAGISNFILFCDGEAGAELYNAAAEREQAALLFDVAKWQVLNEKTLSGNSKIYQRSITYKNSFLKVISAEANSKHGFNSHLVLIDELHAQENRELVDVLLTSTGARQQPLTIYITTADFCRESICNEKYDFACKVRDGIIEDSSFLPCIYEASRTDDWKSPAVWSKANPGLNRSVSMVYIERECMKAQESPAYENTFKRLHLNIQTEQDVRWLNMEKWDACNGGLIASSRDIYEEFLNETLAGNECYGGIDLASTKDISAFSLIFPSESYEDPNESRYYLLPYFWVPEDNAIKRERRDRVPYITWAKHGWIELTPGNVADYDQIRKRINELHKKFNIKKIAIDRWNATQLANQLTGDGFEMEAFGQGFASMSAPSKELEKAVIGERLIHGGNPVLRWMASNVSAEIDAAENIKPSKKKSTEKIDGIVATIMAIGVYIAEEFKRKSVYDRREPGKRLNFV